MKLCDDNERRIKCDSRRRETSTRRMNDTSSKTRWICIFSSRVHVNVRTHHTCIQILFVYFFVEQNRAHTGESYSGFLAGEMMKKKTKLWFSPEFRIQNSDFIMISNFDYTYLRFYKIKIFLQMRRVRFIYKFLLESIQHTRTIVVVEVVIIIPEIASKFIL